MSSFWAFESSGVFDYMFTTNQYVLLLIGLVISVFFSMYFCHKNFQYQRVSVLLTAVFLTIFEIGRIVWRYFYLQKAGQDLSFVNVVDLSFSTISIWLTIFICFVAFFQKKSEQKKVFGLSFVFNVAMISCAISLIYPIGLNGNFEFYHIYNLLYTLIRALVIMLGLSFAGSGWISTEEFVDEWSGILSLAFFGAMCYFAGIIFGNSTNLLYVNFLPLFEEIGMSVPAPFQYLLMGLFFFIIQTIFYTIFRIYKHIKKR
jgi:hypothetical protein